MRRTEYKEKLITRKQNNSQETKFSVESEKHKDNKYVKPKYGPMPTFPNQRFFARGVMILATLIIVYFTSKTNKETILAKQKEVIQGRGQNVDCSPEYMKELDTFPGCVPAKCGRFVSDRLVTETETEKLLDIGKRGLAQGSALGGAAILDLHSGALTKGSHFVNIYSLNNTNQLFSAQDFTTYRVVRTKIQHAVAHQFSIPADSLYLTHPTFFSRLTEKPAVTAHDEYWHPHVDKDHIEFLDQFIAQVSYQEMLRLFDISSDIRVLSIVKNVNAVFFFCCHVETYEAFHYTSLLYLSNYGTEFQGGRFIFQELDNSTVVIEPKKGRVSMFTSGKENLHYIERITSGVRYALTVSFTCDKKHAIKDPTAPILS